MFRLGRLLWMSLVLVNEMKMDITEEEREALINVFELFEYLRDVIQKHEMR